MAASRLFCGPGLFSSALFSYRVWLVVSPLVAPPVVIVAVSWMIKISTWVSWDLLSLTLRLLTDNEGRLKLPLFRHCFD